MRQALDAEKRAAQRLFATRDKQITRVAAGLAGMYGDLQGLAGASLPTVEGLALPETTSSQEPAQVSLPCVDQKPAGDNPVHGP